MTSRPDLGERRSSRLVATAAEDRLSFRRNDADRCPLSPTSGAKADIPLPPLSANSGHCRHSRNGGYGMWAEARPYSALMPAKLITLAHFSDSVATYAPNSVAVKIIGIVPRSASRALMVGFASPALMSRLSRAMISGGVPFGAPTPPHVLASYPGSVSAMV